MKIFIENNIKVFVTIIITTIIVGSVSVYAASQYFAKDINFTPTNENFKKENGEQIENVEDALNALYKKNSVNSIYNKNYSSGDRLENRKTNLELETGKYIIFGTSDYSIVMNNVSSFFEHQLDFRSGYQLDLIHDENVSCNEISYDFFYQYASSKYIDGYSGITSFDSIWICNVNKKSSITLNQAAGDNGKYAQIVRGYSIKIS